MRLLDILSRQGLVERRADASDGRARLIHLTPRGEEHITTIRRALTLKERELLADISDDQLGAMLAHFDMIERRLAESQSRSAGEKSR